MFYGNPQFYGVRAMAANIGQSQGNYTAEQFQQDFPQFFTPSSGENPSVCLVPATMLEEIINMANACVQPDKWLESWRYAVGLYVAHYATLYLRTYAPSNTTAQQAAASGALVGVVKSATLGDSSVTYDTTAVTKGTEDWGDLNSTTYGQMLANRAKLVGLGGSYAI
ncbi:DUF4054 domain-containing protein [Pseudoflavonifractor phocaeensis]|uniref:DUF4054 domain-containing protein n=1 Tax=Pseudoflavonifractor phocaeensis TaxID=1870988 RepID=UPI00195B4ED5|nr:DUF4054 domain-containing protein [Pseudoflavonifractor phocaeensis]MBM6887174.1 DUF4054 domain-containing protein [Pseudoflavonifractor phocaeensis]